ncbi:MAG: hypothetical protein Q9166_003754 [cf. Caloplaca sp. 2 TL-2023]
MARVKRTRPARRERSTDLHPENEPDNNDLLPHLPYTPPFPSSSSRKRSFEDEGIGDSSDTPLFSSDDNPASSENYLEYRNKRQRKGPWWSCQPEQQLLNRYKAKREFRRNLDSGVWMGSDSDLEDGLKDLEMGNDPEPKLLLTLALESFEDPEVFDGPAFPYWDVQPDSPKAFWQIQKAAVKEINRCIDHGAEIVDLSDFGLLKLQEPTLKPLQTLIAERRISQPDAKWQRFGSFVPDIQLYLANNSLSQLPGQLFKLQNLAVLSLRHNNLTEIPLAICSLINLRELNISNNSLQWLPYEIRHLLQRSLRTLRFLPNPFIKPILKPASRLLTASPFHSTKPAYLQVDGTLVRGSQPSPSTIYHWSRSEKSTSTDQSYLDHPHKVPSLFETSLRACCNSPQLSQLPFLVPEDAPATVVLSLKHAWKLKQEGGRRCTICRSSYIIHRTEWIEWWQLSASERVTHSISTDFDFPARPRSPDIVPIGSPVPLIRRGCSWSCVPTDDHNRVEVSWTPVDAYSSTSNHDPALAACPTSPTTTEPDPKDKDKAGFDWSLYYFPLVGIAYCLYIEARRTDWQDVKMELVKKLDVFGVHQLRRDLNNYICDDLERQRSLAPNVNLPTWNFLPNHHKRHQPMKIKGMLDKVAAYEKKEEQHRKAEELRNSVKADPDSVDWMERFAAQVQDPTKKQAFRIAWEGVSEEDKSRTRRKAMELHI